MRTEKQPFYCVPKKQKKNNNCPLTRFEVCFSRRLCVEEEFRISRRHGYYYDKKPRRIRLHLTSTVLHGLAFTVQMCTCAWVCCLCCPCTFQCPLRLCWNVCTRGHFFCFCTESFHCAVSFGWTAPSHLVLSTASIISSLNVVSYGGGGEGGETFLAIVIAKCFLTFRRGSLGILGGSEELFGFCVAWPPVYQSRYTWHKHKIVRNPG